MSLFTQYHMQGMVLFAGVPAIESLAPLYLVKLKPSIPLGAADVPTVACILQFRNSYLCSAFDFLFVLVSILRNTKVNLIIGKNIVEISVKILGKDGAISCFRVS